MAGHVSGPESAEAEAECGCGDYWSTLAQEDLEELYLETGGAGEDLDEAGSEAPLGPPGGDTDPGFPLEELREALEEFEETGW
jgi:hypothetical protein